MSDTSNSSTKSVGHHLLSDIDRVKQTSITYGKRNGFFVSRERLTAMEKTLSALLSGNKQTTIERDSLKQAKVDLDGLHAQYNNTVAELKATKLDRDSARNDLSSAKAELSRINKIAKDQVASHNKLRAEHVKTIDSLKDQIKKTKQTVSDPTDRENKIKDLTSQIAAANARANEENMKTKKLNSELNLQYAKVKTLKSEADALRDKVKDYYDSTKETSSRERTDLFDVSEKSKDEWASKLGFGSLTIETALSKYSKAKLKDIAEGKVDNLVKQAELLLQSAKDRDPTSYVGYLDLAKEILKTAKKGVGIHAAWFNKVVRHFIASLINPGKITFDQVRELYEAKQGRKEFTRKRSNHPKPTLFTTVMTDAYVSVRKVLDKTKKKCFDVFKATKQRLCSFYGFLKRGCRFENKGKGVVPPTHVDESQFPLWPSLDDDDQRGNRTWAQVVGTLWDAEDMSEPELDTHPTAGPSEP